MDPTPFVAALEMNAPAIVALARAVPPHQVRWPPAPGEWSALEVINHLANEEDEDFRTRLDTLLHGPGEDPPPIDPEGWVVARADNARGLDESLDRFLAGRRQSLAWLRALGTPDWSRSWRHPEGFTIRAGDLLAAWAGHDLLHLRQLVDLQYRGRTEGAAPYDVAYAGPW